VPVELLAAGTRPARRLTGQVICQPLGLLNPVDLGQDANPTSGQPRFVALGDGQGIGQRTKRRAGRLELVQPVS
jgi:hypothetical protein